VIDISRRVVINTHSDSMSSFLFILYSMPPQNTSSASSGIALRSSHHSMMSDNDDWTLLLLNCLFLNLDFRLYSCFFEICGSFWSMIFFSIFRFYIPSSKHCLTRSTVALGSLVSFAWWLRSEVDCQMEQFCEVECYLF